MGTLLRIAGWGPLRADDTRLEDAPGEAADVPDVRPRPALLSVARMSCTNVGTAPSPWRIAGAGMRAVSPEGAWAFERAGEHRTRVRWSGERGRGEAILPFDAPTQDAPPGLWGGAGRAILAAPDEPRLFEVRGATARELPASLLPDASIVRRFWSEGADVVLDGGALTVQTTGELAGLQVDLGLTVDAGGAPTRRYATRGRPLDEPPTLALARRDGRWSRALVNADGVRVISPDGAVGLLPGWTGALPLCAGSAAAGAVTLRIVGCSTQRHCLANALLFDPARELAEVELGGGGACLRALRVTARGHVGVARREDFDRPAVPVVWNLRAAPGGALAGFSDDGVRRAAVRCVRE